MFRPINSRFAGYISLSILLLGVYAMGQFEVAPDHFDSTGKRNGASRSHGKNPDKTSAGSESAGRSPRKGSHIAGRQAKSADFQREKAYEGVFKAHSYKNHRSAGRQVAARRWCD